MCQAEEVTEGGAEQVTSGRVTVEDRSLNNAYQNAVVLSTLLLADHNNYRLCQVFFAVGQPLKDWHSAQSRDLTSCAASLTFLYDQVVDGAFYKSVCAIIGTLFSVATLERCGFIVSSQAFVWQ